MFNEFVLDASAESLAGYHWHAGEPDCVVCLVHGIGEHAGRYGRMAAMFGASRIDVLSVDLRGHGCSPGVRGHCAPRRVVLSDVDSLLRYAESRYPGKPLVLYGHSMGGNIVLDFMVRGTLSAKPCAYVISSPWIELVNKAPQLAYGFIKAMSLAKPDFLVGSGIKPEYLGNPEIIEAEKRAELVHRCISLETVADCIGVGKALVKGKLKGNGGGLGKPMLVMHGSGDKICSIDSTRKFASLQGGNCTYVEWEGYFHEIHNGNSEKDGKEVIEAAIEWIRRLPELSG